jgi:hypothetical protein
MRLNIGPDLTGCWHRIQRDETGIYAKRRRLVGPCLLMLIITAHGHAGTLHWCLFFSKSMYERKVSARDRQIFAYVVIEDSMRTTTGPSRAGAMYDFATCWKNHVTFWAHRPTSHGRSRLSRRVTARSCWNLKNHVTFRATRGLPNAHGIRDLVTASYARFSASTAGQRLSGAMRALTTTTGRCRDSTARWDAATRGTAPHHRLASARRAQLRSSTAR